MKNETKSLIFLQIYNVLFILPKFFTIFFQEYIFSPYTPSPLRTQGFFCAPRAGVRAALANNA